MLVPKYKKIIMAAQEGGLILEKHFNERFKYCDRPNLIESYLKGLDLATKKIVQTLHSEFPSFDITYEEGELVDKKSVGAKSKAKYSFIVESIDGLTNFKLGIPYFSTTITLIEDKDPIFTLVYHPLLKKAFYAFKGKGAYVNGKTSTVYKVSNPIDNAVIAYTCGYDDSGDFYDKLRGIIKETKAKRILTNWCPTLDYALLANGNLDAVINNNNELFDFLAGKLLAREAGAVIMDFNGEKLGPSDLSSAFIAAATESLAYKLVEVIKKIG